MPYIVGAIVGAIIGYFTNWLAIKMLFKPRTQKRIAGIRVPFTPGLIPKEKERIAKSIAQSVGEHLINQESISKTLNKPTIRDRIKLAINDKAMAVLGTEGNLDERFKSAIGNGYEEKSLAIENKIYNKVIKTIQNEEKQNNISEYASKFILKKLQQKPDFIVRSLKKIDLETFASKLADKIDGEEGTEFMVTSIDKIIENLESSNKNINECIPKQGLKIIESVVYDNKSKISEAVISLLDDEEISMKIKRVVIKDVLGAAGPFVTMFGGTDAIYNKLKSALSNTLSEEETQIIICNHLVRKIGQLSDSKVSDLIKKIPTGFSIDLAVFMTGKISDILKDKENIEKFRTKVIELISEYDSYDQMLSKLDENYVQKLEDLIKSSVKQISDSEEIKSGVRSMISQAKTEILSYEISKDDETKEEIINSLSVIFDSQYDKFLEQDLKGVIELLDIQTMVEEQINAFEVDEAEKIITGIASKELSAITWLGGLLGGILGILSPFLSNFYS